VVKHIKGKYEKRRKNDGSRLSESGFDMWRVVVKTVTNCGVPYGELL
jgi:hypothetical protein